MTEEQWLSHTDPYDLLMPFPGKWDHRKLWLFGCACFRRAWHLLTDVRARNCVEMAERLVDGRATEQEAASAWEIFFEAADDELYCYRGLDTHEAIRNLVCFVDPAASLTLASEVAEGVGAAASESIPGESSSAKAGIWRKAKRQERVVQADLLRDIFGPLPFRTVAVNSSMLTPKVIAIARTMYDSRAFERMPELGDALQEAGCTNADMLKHCREPGVHVRGCWAIDLLLGKE